MSCLGSVAIHETVTVSISTVTAVSGALVPGKYRVWSSVDCFVRQGASTVTATTAAGTPLAAGRAEYWEIFDAASNAGYMASITAAGTGTLYLTRQ